MVYELKTDTLTGVHHIYEDSPMSLRLVLSVYKDKTLAQEIVDLLNKKECKELVSYNADAI